MALGAIFLMCLLLILSCGEKKIVSSNAVQSTKEGCELLLPDSDGSRTGMGIINCYDASSWSMDLEPLITDRVERIVVEKSYFGDDFRLNSFVNATGLRYLRLEGCHLYALTTKHSSAFRMESLRELHLAGNELVDLPNVVDNITRAFPNLEVLNLASNHLSCDHDGWAANLEPLKRLRILHLEGNWLEAVQSCLRLPQSLQILDLSQNQIGSIEGQKNGSKGSLPPGLIHLNLSHNQISRFQFGEDGEGGGSFIRTLDLSNNLMTGLDGLGQGMTGLRMLNVSFNPVEEWPESTLSSSARLENVQMEQSHLRWLNISWMNRFQSLKEINLADSSQLSGVYGILDGIPGLTQVNLSNCQIETFAPEFFQRTPQSSLLTVVDVSGNPFTCSYCQLEWYQRAVDNGMVQFWDTNGTACVSPASKMNVLLKEVEINETNSDCSVLGVSPDAVLDIQQRYGRNRALRCPLYGLNSLKGNDFVIEWTRIRGARHTFAGSWHIGYKRGRRIEPGNGSAVHGGEILPGGQLFLPKVNKFSVAEYVCSVKMMDTGEEVVNATVLFTLDYSDWQIHVQIYSIFCGIATAMGFFALNVIWAGIRSIIVWRIAQLEKTSRVRRMVEAIEKYRQRQMDSLTEEYTHRMDRIRNNYHDRCEQLRHSYSHQSERFKGYKAAQIGAVQETITGVRDNYSGQMTRMRDYGGRQMGRLSESYQRQLNAIRTFSLQQRLRLMRQYKIKQGVLNALLESLNIEPGTNVVHVVNDLPIPRLPDDDEDIIIGGPSVNNHVHPTGSSAVQLITQSSAAAVDDDDILSLSSYHTIPPEPEDDDDEKDHRTIPPEPEDDDDEKDHRTIPPEPEYDDDEKDHRTIPPQSATSKMASTQL